ncbi:MAG: hypothetical protein QM766_25530 [Burkholderiaceae bacterium]
MIRPIFRFILGVLIAVVLAEGLLRVLPVSTATESGYYIDPEILTYPAHHVWTSSTGWDLKNAHRHLSNNAGFLADRDFVPDPNAIALIGDSYVEASMLDPDDRPAAQLARLISTRPVYAMGGPGSSLLDYAERIRFAATTYGIRDFVLLLERADVRQALCGSGNIHGPCIDRQTLVLRDEHQPPPTLMKRLVRQSAFAQYLFGQLKIDPQSAMRMMFGRISADEQREPERRSAQVETDGMKAFEAVVDDFASKTQRYVKGRLIVVIDGDRSRIYQGLEPRPDPSLDLLIARLHAQRIPIVDGQPLLAEYYQRSSRRLDVGPYDHHLNPVGVRLLMQPVARLLASE